MTEGNLMRKNITQHKIPTITIAGIKQPLLKFDNKKKQMVKLSASEMNAGYLPSITLVGEYDEKDISTHGGILPNN